jgi:glutathione S-transferase
VLRLHDYLPSGNGYKVRLVLHQLERPFELVEYDVTAGETRTRDFLERVNPNGRVPVLELDDGRMLPESNAILWFLAEGTPLLSHDPFERAQTLQWMCFEQYSHEPNIATLRFWLTHARIDLSGWRRELVAEKRAAGEAALHVMERHLATRSYFVGERRSIADVALYAYTHVAEEGGFDLEPYAAVRAWLARVAAAPGHVPITWRPGAA